MNIHVAPIVPSFLVQSGLTAFTPVSNPAFSIQGDDSQILTLAVEPNQEVVAEPGAMCFASNDMEQKTRIRSLTGMVSGESLFKAKWLNKGTEPGFVAFTAAVPSTIIPLNLDSLGNCLLCSPGAFLAAINPQVTVTIGLAPSRSALACCCGGVPPIMQSVKGTGWVFLSAHGTIMQRMLTGNDEIVVDTNSIVALAHSITIDVRKTGGCCTMCCSGEGLFNTSLRGPGMVILTSMTIPKLQRLFPMTQGRN